MKQQNILIAIGILFVSGLLFITKKNIESSSSDTSTLGTLKEKHTAFLKKSPYKNAKNLSKTERYNQGLPPNKYFDQLAELTMNPTTGIPAPTDINTLRKSLQSTVQTKSTPGRFDNIWEERGPNNVGGRTRALLFDPYDDRRVFAGGVSGGLWLNPNIDDPNSTWNEIEGISNHVNVTSIVVDPNNSDVMYVGTGESYTQGDVLGNGVYISKDRGMHWVLMKANLPEDTLNNSSDLFTNGIVFINDLIAWNNNGTTELYAAVGSNIFPRAANPRNWIGASSTGLYKVIDPANQAEPRLTRIETNELLAGRSGRFNFYKTINDLEIDADGNLWAATGVSRGFNFPGGDILKSVDGINFTIETSIANSRRTELEPSTYNPNKFYVAYWNFDDNTNEAQLLITEDAFNTTTKLPEPDDVDRKIPANDYTKGQAFYNLLIESHPDNDNILYIGGIDLFVSDNSGQNWNQISKWSNNNDLATLDVPLVHGDHHAMVFRPSNTNQAIFGNDGGVYFSNSLNIGRVPQGIDSRNKGYNVTQFVSASIGPDGPNATTEIFTAGSQDNGTQAFQNATNGVNASKQIMDGDGFRTFIDKDGSYAIASFPFNGIHRFKLPWDGRSRRKGGSTLLSKDTKTGDFVNQMGYDSETNLLLLNASVSSEPTGKIQTINVASTVNGSLQNAALANTKPTALRPSPYEDNTWLIGTANAGLIKLTNVTLNTADWEEIKTPFVGSISNVRYGQSEEELFVTLYNYGVSNVWHSTDGGTTWQNKDRINNLPDFPVYDILQNPLQPKEVMLATAFGVWATTDITKNDPKWFRSINGMKNVSVTSFDYWARNGDDTDHIIIASTYGRGVFTGKFTTEDGTDTEAPTIEEFTATNITQTTADFSWVAKDNSEISFQILFNDDFSIDKVIDPVFRKTTLENLTPNTVYNFFISVDDAAFNITDSDFLTIVTKSDIDFCESRGLDTNHEFIGRVSLGAIDNISDQGINGYSDFTNGTLFASLARDKEHTISINPTWLQGARKEGYRAWIDYNQDGVFDPTEMIVEIPPIATTPVSASFTIPTDALNGATRIRIAMKRDGLSSACQVFENGEVEDYTVIIEEGATIRATPLATNNELVTFPNPVVNGLLQVELPNTVTKSAATTIPYMIYNITGNTVQQGTITDTPVNISNLSKGAYFIKVFTENQQYTKKIMKK